MSYFSKPTLQLSDKIWLSAICVILLSINSSFVFASALCQEYYSEKPSTAKEVKDSHSQIGSDIFTLAEVREGMHGGKRYVIKTKVAWHDYIKDFSEEGGDLVQDLRLYASLLGKKAGHFFGYEILDANHVVVPSGLEISNAIKKFNENLPENDPRRILIGLYPTEEGLVDPRIYKHEFIKNSRIPISLKRKHFFHDIAGHALQGFFIPNELTYTTRKRLEILQKFANHIQNSNPTDAEKINKLIVSIIDEISNLAGFYLDADTKIKLGRLGRQLYENSELVRNNSDRDKQYELSQSYAPVPAYLKVAGESKVIYRGNTSTGGIKRRSRPFIFLNSSLEKSLNSLKTFDLMILSDKTYEEFKNFLSNINQDLKFESDSNLSEILYRMEQAQDRRNIFVPSKIDRLKNFVFRRKSIEQLTPEEIVIQQRITHAEQLMMEN